MKTKSLFLLLFCLLITVSCSKDDVEARFTIGVTGDVTFTGGDDLQKVINITCTNDWKATSSERWLTVSPAQGGSGTFDLTITANSENATNTTRTATITLTSGDVSERITVNQDATDVVETDTDEYEIGVEGGVIEISFTTNIPKDQLLVQYTGSAWISEYSNPDGRALSAYKLAIQVSPNTEGKTRSAAFGFYRKREGQEALLVKTLTIQQYGKESESSTDFSKDGEVQLLQSATIGTGVPIVIAGDGFIDKEVADGTYDKVMKKAMENLFTEEPIKSLRPYFNVYAVTAVSKNNDFGGENETVFGCKLEGGMSTLIEGNSDVCMNYAKKANVDLAETLMVVILNTPQYAGTTSFHSINSKPVEFAIAYCPVIENLESENFRRVLVHEAVGHGFAKLLDEYSYEESGAIPQEEIENTQQLQAIGWAQNVDFTGERTEVLWNRFLSDSRYDWEKLSVIEGACTYWTGAYRPSVNSIMRENILGFNAPSREAIYKRVMKSSNPAWVYNYEEFVAYDLEHVDKTAFSRSVEKGSRPFASPRFANKDIRE